MNRKSLKCILMVLILALGSIATGCGDSKKESDLNTANSVRILSAENYIPFIIADQKGFFQEAFGEDVEVTYAQSDSGSMIMETMTAGDVDFAALGDMPVIQAKENGLDVKVISSFFTSATGYQLVAAKDSDIHSIADLKGKKVAVMSGSTNHKLLLKYLEAENMTEEDLEIVYLKRKDQLAAFVAKSVDAAVTQEPTSTTIEQETGAYEVVNAEGYDNIATLVVGRQEFMEQNPEYVEKFLQALIKATEWIENNQEEALQIAADYTGDTYSNMEIYYQTRSFSYSLNDDIQKGLEDTIEYLYQQNTIKNKPALEELVDESYLKAIGVD